MIEVTITGADDAVDPAELVALSRDFPFVEWGILFSLSRMGTPRYPAGAWLALLSLAAEDAQGMRLAAHACGEWSRSVQQGHDRFGVWSSFRRVQLNGWNPTGRPESLPRIDAEYILQARDERMLALAVQTASELTRLGQRASVLYDFSGGTGAAPFRWPSAPYGAQVGYAGGIGPDNVEQVIADIQAERLTDSRPFWIDMESGVRTDDRFDLGKVRAVLERVAKARQRIGAVR